MPSCRIGLWLLAVPSGLIYLLAPILTPFVVAALFAYLADPLTDRLENWKRTPEKPRARGRTRD